MSEPTPHRTPCPSSIRHRSHKPRGVRGSNPSSTTSWVTLVRHVPYPLRASVSCDLQNRGKSISQGSQELDPICAWHWALSCHRLEMGTFQKSLRAPPSPLCSQQSQRWETGGGWETAPPPTPAPESSPASSAELGAPRFSEKPPFHGLIEYLNNLFIPARHKECCPNSGDSGRRPRAQWLLEWGCYSGRLLLARSSG